MFILKNYEAYFEYSPEERLRMLEVAVEGHKKYFKCSLEERLGLLETAKTIVDLAQLAKRKGLIALEYEVRNSTDTYLTYCIECIADAMESKEFLEKASIRLISSGTSNADRLRRYMILESCERLQKGHGQHSIREVLLGILGEDVEAMLMPDTFELKEAVEESE